MKEQHSSLDLNANPSIASTSLSLIRSEYDPELRTLWTYMGSRGRPSYTLEILEQLRVYYQHLSRTGRFLGMDESLPLVEYDVADSDFPGVFNLGGDLKLFKELIEARDRDGLMTYAVRCIDNMHMRIKGYESPITTFSLVRGKALGGGFEAALASDFVIAEKNAMMGVPEVRFNLFPGMGAYSILTRLLGIKKAEDVLYKGAVLPASDWFDMGVIDAVVEVGEGRQYVDAFISEHRKLPAGRRAIRKCRNHLNPITREELIAITTIWVDTALELRHKDLLLMQGLVAKQENLEPRA
jgi:DSF synthase